MKTTNLDKIHNENFLAENLLFFLEKDEINRQFEIANIKSTIKSLWQYVISKKVSTLPCYSSALVFPITEVPTFIPISVCKLYGRLIFIA